MSEETARIRDKFKQLLKSSIATSGSKGENLKEFCKLFLEDWSENVIDYAHLLGFSNGKENPTQDILNLLKSFPEEVIVNELSDGTIYLRPIVTDDIKENLVLIDKTNKENKNDKLKYIKESIRAKQQQRNQQKGLPNPNTIPIKNLDNFPNGSARLAQSLPPAPSIAHLITTPPLGFQHIQPLPQQQGGGLGPKWTDTIINGQQQIPIQPQQQPPRFFPSQPPRQHQLPPVWKRIRSPSTKAQHRSMPPPPNLPGGSKNANLVPLGPNRCIAPPRNQQQMSGSELNAAYSHLQQSSNSSKQNGHIPVSNLNNKARLIVNDFGGVVQQPQKNKNKIERNIQQQAFSSTSGQQKQPQMMNGHIAESKNWVEDFQVPPSNETDRKGSLVGSRKRIDIWQEPNDNEEEEKGCMEEFEDVNGDEECWETESEWECDVEMDREWAEDNAECITFFDEMQQCRRAIPSNLYRLIHLFRLNDGVYSSSKLEKLQNAYNDAFHEILSTKEWNRLLGNEETIKIVKDCVKRCKWPASGMFKIIEKTSSYEIVLLRALTDAAADPTIFFRQNAPSSSSSAAAQTSSSRYRSLVQPSPISSIVGGRQVQSPATISTFGRNSNSSSLLSLTSSLPSPIPLTTNGGGGQGPSSNSKDFEQFAALAIFVQNELFKAKNGPRKPLNVLFERIKALAHPQQFSAILLDSEAALLGYLRLFSESFLIEFQGSGIFVTTMNIQPNSQNCTFPTDFSLFYNNSYLHRGERHKVIMVDYNKQGIHVVLQLSEIFRNLKELLNDYKQILEDIREHPFENCLPNQWVFFLDGANQSLCRGQFIRTDGEDRAVVHDIDQGRERYILRNHIFQLSNNFPNWRFPSCHLSAQFVDVNETKLKQLLSQANCEFTVDIVEVLPNFCRVRLVVEQ